VETDACNFQHPPEAEARFFIASESRQALLKMLFTCRNVVIGVTGQPLNHSSTTSVGNQLAAAGHDRSGDPWADRQAAATAGPLPTRRRPRASSMQLRRG
jgi:hypothetical protein